METMNKVLATAINYCWPINICKKHLQEMLNRWGDPSREKSRGKPSVRGEIFVRKRGSLEETLNLAKTLGDNYGMTGESPRETLCEVENP